MRWVVGALVVGLVSSFHSPRPVRPLLRPRPSRVLMNADNNQNLKTRLREEAEAPFEVARQLLWAASGAGATASALISLSQCASGSVSLEQAAGNFVIDAVVISGSAYLWSRDAKRRETRQARVERGAEFAALKVRLQLEGGSERTVPLAELRRERLLPRRVVVVAGSFTPVQASVNATFELLGELLEVRVGPCVRV